MTSIVWFRQDLRITANPAFNAAIEKGSPIVAVFILNQEQAWPLGAASRVWLHHSLGKLSESLLNIGVDLVFRLGNPAAVLSELVDSVKADAIYWNSEYEPDAIDEAERVTAKLNGRAACHPSNGRLLVEPMQMSNKAGKPFRVFTPFWRQLRGSVPEMPIEARVTNSDNRWSQAATPVPVSSLKELGLLTNHAWEKKLAEQWQFGEAAAQRMLDDFIDGAITEYPDKRDIPEVDGTSRLSAYFHFGEISVQQAWQAISQRIYAGGFKHEAAAEAWLRQLAWREFSHHLLFHFPHTAQAPLNEKFSNLQWIKNKELLLLWQTGRTGYPLVDAGMRQLWHTGWMHNRVRMVVASFLTKHLGIHWLTGAKWFWDTLFDADLANNSMGWQWVAGCGADAAPYYRIFNPTRQSERFDATGAYIKRWVPELRELDSRLVHAPNRYFDNPLFKLDYPQPCVEHRSARELALQRYQEIRT
jgi:deoxyribodipyrimidine photo-lyase